MLLKGNSVCTTNAGLITDTDHLFCSSYNSLLDAVIVHAKETTGHDRFNALDFVCFIVMKVAR